MPTSTAFKSSLNDEVFRVLYKMAYQSKLKGVVGLKRETEGFYMLQN